MRFTELLKLVESAGHATDVVGALDEDRDKRVRRARAELHPDRHTGTDRIQAEHAFARLEELLANEKKHRAAKHEARMEIVTKRNTYLLDGLAYKGLVANLYNIKYTRDGKEKHGLLKIARSPRDSDLIVAEGDVLKAVYKARNDQDEPDRRIPFYPRPEEVFTYRDGVSHIDRRAIAQRRFSGFVSLDQVLKHFPHGLDVRDLAWIWRRVLVGISLAHDLGYVHGSLTPGHILIHPKVHGVQLIGWGQSVPIDGRVKVLGDPDSSYFPPEILNKEPASTASDIYTLSKTFQRAIDPHTPGSLRFNAFANGCTFERAKGRPQSALGLLGEYNELLEKAFGPRKFRSFPDFPGRTTSAVTG